MNIKLANFFFLSQSHTHSHTHSHMHTHSHLDTHPCTRTHTHPLSVIFIISSPKFWLRLNPFGLNLTLTFLQKSNQSFIIAVRSITCRKISEEISQKVHQLLNRTIKPVLTEVLQFQKCNHGSGHLVALLGAAPRPRFKMLPPPSFKATVRLIRLRLSLHQLLLSSVSHERSKGSSCGPFRCGHKLCTVLLPIPNR